MSSSLSDILNNRPLNEPPEIEVIKQFVMKHFDQTPGIKLTETTILITVPSAALAGALRPRLHELEELAQTKKRLTIRIGTS